MTDIPIITVNAFTDRLFRGNTCAVCLFEAWPEDSLLLAIAKENGYAETAYILTQSQPELRWFTVSQEVDFCGYGTLSAGFVYLTHVAKEQEAVTFKTKNYGFLPVRKKQDLLQVDVPVKRPLEPRFEEAVARALGAPSPREMIASERDDLVLVYENEAAVRAAAPDIPALMATGHYGYVLTAPGADADYVFRYFSPRMTNVWEDPVNGASQSVLAPFWAARLGKADLHGQAVSARGGDVYCAYPGGETVTIGGQVRPYLTGLLHL